MLFAGFWGGVIAFAALGFKQGSPQTLLYGLDYDGHTCGKNNKARATADRAARGITLRMTDAAGPASRAEQVQRA